MLHETMDIKNDSSIIYNFHKIKKFVKNKK